MTTAEKKPSAEDMIAALGSILDPLPSVSQLTEQVAEEMPEENSHRICPAAQVEKVTLASNLKEEKGALSKKRKEAELEVASSESLSQEGAANCTLPKPIAKRPRGKEKPRIRSTRSEISKAAKNLRRDGITPITLFFPSLPDELKKDLHLRSAIGPGLQDLKTIQARGNKKMAWATFASEGECLDKLLALRLAFPSLIVSLHRPQQQQEGSIRKLQGHEKNELLFDRSSADVLSRGGLGNTLLFRNIPVEVEISEFENLLKDALQKASVNCDAVRIRTALSKGGVGRTFWVVYPSIDACKVAFSHFLLKTVSFRCGKTTKLHPFIHDDSKDADESKRRERAAALGPQSSRRGAKSISKPKMKNSIDILERFLRSTQQSFAFLPICDDSTQ